MGLIVYWSIIKFHYISQAVVTDVGVSHYPSVLHYFCSNHWDSNTATQRSSLPVRQNASHSDWCLKLEQGRNYTNKITHLWVIGGCLGWAEAHINHNKDTYWLSVGFTLVMMSERIEGARRCIVQMDFHHKYSYKSVYSKCHRKVRRFRNEQLWNIVRFYYTKAVDA